MKHVNSITDLVGRTPVVRLQRIPHKESAEVYVKLEFFNRSIGECNWS